MTTKMHEKYKHFKRRNIVVTEPPHKPERTDPLTAVDRGSYLTTQKQTFDQYLNETLYASKKRSGAGSYVREP